jgi:hypothetical protein
LKKKLVVQEELYKTYELARKEEERKVENNRHKTKHYEEWKDSTKIVSMKEMKEFQKVVDIVIS